MDKLLGKIKSAEYGVEKDMPYLMGLSLPFSLEGGTSGVSDGGIYYKNMSSSCKWPKDGDRSRHLARSVDLIFALLESAKVYKISDLVGKPVEVTLENRAFKSFRILKEVL